MSKRQKELINAAMLIYKHCQNSECRACPLRWKDDDDSDDLYDSSCRLDASYPMHWDMDRLSESEDEQ